MNRVSSLLREVEDTFKILSPEEKLFIKSMLGNSTSLNKRFDQILERSYKFVVKKYKWKSK